MPRAYCIVPTGSGAMDAWSRPESALAKIGVTITGREPISDAGERWYLEGAALPDLTGHRGNVLVNLETWGTPALAGEAPDDSAVLSTSESGFLFWVKVTNITVCPGEWWLQATETPDA